MKYPGDQGIRQGEKMAMSFEGRDKNGEKDSHHTEGNHQEDRFVVFLNECHHLLPCMQELPADTTAQLIQNYQTEVQSIFSQL